MSSNVLNCVDDLLNGRRKLLEDKPAGPRKVHASKWEHPRDTLAHLAKRLWEAARRLPLIAYCVASRVGRPGG